MAVQLWTERMLSFMRQIVVGDKLEKIKTLLQVYSVQWRKMLLFTLLSLLLSLLAVGEIQLFSNFIDSLTASASWQGWGLFSNPLLKTFTLFVGILIAQAFLAGVLNLLALHVKSALDCQLKNKLAYKLCTMPYVELESKEIQDALSRVRESEYTPFGFWQDVFKLLHYGVQFCGMLFIMAQSSLWPALLLFCAVLAFIPLLLKAGQENYQAYQQASSKFRQAAYISHVLYEREYAKERRTFAYTNYFNNLWFKDFEAGRLLSQAATKKNFLKLKTASISGLFIFIACALILLLPLKNAGLSLGVYIAILTTFFKILEFLKNDLYYLFEELSGEYAYLQELASLLYPCGDQEEGNAKQSAAALAAGTADAEAAVTEPMSVVMPHSLTAKQDANKSLTAEMKANAWRKIEFKNVSFTYPNGEKQVLQNINLTFTAGKVYALVGSNGAGKSTLINLLSALYTDYSGEILIDGVELRQLPRRLLQSKLALAAQKFEKFALSAAEFLSLGQESNLTVESLATLPAGLQISALLADLKDGLATKLGRLEDEARDLSGGQWQRLVIARALLRDADLFIFDEPTASLDPNAEKAVYQELLASMKQGIGLLITHRLGAVAEVDNIILLADGKVQATGSHQDLLNKSPLYAEMYEAQRSWYE